MENARSRRVFVIGAGMSCEVGTPAVGGLLPAILDSMPRSKTTNLRSYLAGKPSSRDIEKIRHYPK